MEPAVFMFEDRMLSKWYLNNEYSEAETEARRSRYLDARGKCRGFFNDNAADVGVNALYSPCRGDGQACFHRRWHRQ
jgi:hypothetical protein